MLRNTTFRQYRETEHASLYVVKLLKEFMYKKKRKKLIQHIIFFVRHRRTIIQSQTNKLNQSPNLLEGEGGGGEEISTITSKILKNGTNK